MKIEIETDTITEGMKITILKNKKGIDITNQESIIPDWENRESLLEYISKIIVGALTQENLSNADIQWVIAELQQQAEVQQ